MNRAQRRNAQRNPAMRTKQQTIQSLQRNGITIADLEKNHRIGFEEGWKAAQDFYLTTCYAAAIRVLRRNADVTPSQCADFLREMDMLISTSITDEEAAAEALAEAGVEFHFAEALPEDRVEEVRA